MCLQREASDNNEGGLLTCAYDGERFHRVSAFPTPVSAPMLRAYQIQWLPTQSPKPRAYCVCDLVIGLLSYRDTGLQVSRDCWFTCGWPTQGVACVHYQDPTLEAMGVGPSLS